MIPSTSPERILQRIIDIQQIPSPTFHEEKRALFIKEKYEEEGLEDVSVDEGWNVFARLPGVSREKHIVVTAHLDTVFPLNTNLTIVRETDRIAGPGIGDNSTGLAALFGLLWDLQKEKIRLPGDLWLVANSGEEGVGDLKGMKNVVNRFGDLPLAYIVLEGMAYGRIYHKGLGVRRYRITCHTPGGHSWVDYGNPSAINELSSLATKLTSLKLPFIPRTTINIGRFNGGISVNSIASEAIMELDLRSESSEELTKLADRIESLVTESIRTGVEISFEVIGNRESGEVAVSHPLVRLAIDVLKRQGITPELSIGSTDANVPLSRGIPAICIGVTNGGYGHTKDEYIFTKQIDKGITQIVEIVKGAFDVIRDKGS